MKWQGFAALVVFIFVFHSCYKSVQGDVYMHMPRGCNNRLSGSKVNVINQNRLFDSQNNAKGGYNVGDSSEENVWNEEPYFMSGPVKGKSILTIEWTNQHGCNNNDLNCNIVLQYKCQPSAYKNKYDPYLLNRMRNGQTTKKPSPPSKNIKAYKTYARKEAAKKRSLKAGQGLHESWEWYSKCNLRQRNSGLFTADQDIDKDLDSTYTRQNPNGGNQRGFECPEERDYYPYWHPTDWKDIVILNDGDFDCDYYEQHSFNGKKKGECLEKWTNAGKKATEEPLPAWRHYSGCNNPTCCKGDNKWVEFLSCNEIVDRTEAECNRENEAWGIPYASEDMERLDEDITKSARCCVQPSPVKCQKSKFSRTNHLGNGLNGRALTYDWVLPHFAEEQRCVLRIRYNISTQDYNGKETNAKHNTVKDDDSDKNVEVIQNNPLVVINVDSTTDIRLQLALNTAQTGRTFQDRSHIFKLIERKKDECENQTIYNLNVRGKRGNIVQTFPAVEYDFAPKDTTMSSDDCLHIQWSGSNSNPKNNAGEGKAGTDRSNIVTMEDPGVNYPFSTIKDSMFYKATFVHAVDQDPADPLTTQTGEDAAVYMATSGRYKSVNDLSKNLKPCITKNKSTATLDCAPPSSHGLVLKWPKSAKDKYYFMCTRNNQFSNRNQKGSLTVV